MLYVYYGTDGKKVSQILSNARERLQKKAPYAHVMRVTDEDEVDMENILHAQGLFYSRRIIVFDSVLANKEIREEVFKYLKAMQASEHVFFIKEAKLHAAHEKKLKTHAAKMQKYDLITHHVSSATQQNDFALANAFGTRKRSASWVELHRALARGVAPEALHGMLFWKAKSLLMKGGTATFQQDGLEQAVGRLAVLPQESRRKGVELEYALELFLLRGK